MPAARELAPWPRVSPLEQHHVAEPERSQEPRASRRRSSPADDDRVGAVAARWSCSRRWHRLNSQSTRRVDPRERRTPMYGLTPEDLELQARARGFADELIPHEQYAEEHDGELPDGRRPPARGPGRRARADRRPTSRPSWAVAGCSTLQQVLVQEQGGRVTNAPRLVPDHAARLVARGRQRPPARDLPDPDRRGPARGVLRDHRGVRRLRRLRPAGDRRPRRRRLRPQRREVARDVVQQGRLRASSRPC